jgi:formate dehydrogenase subunit beta
MTIRGIIPVDHGDTLGALRELLRALLDKKIVDAVLVPVQGAGESVMPELVKNPARLSRADPLAPVMAVNSARLVSQLTRGRVPGGGGGDGRLGVVLRSCEIRALIELAKFNQASLDDVLIVGVDCYGTFSVPAYGKALRESPDLTAHMLAQAAKGSPAGAAFRTACIMCERPAPEHADISVGFIGVDSAQALAIQVRDDLAEPLGVQADRSAVSAREAALAAVASARTAVRDTVLTESHAQMVKIGMASYFANCLECTNCMNACPICYCKECFFRTSTSQRSARELLSSAGRMGAISMPVDAQLFQLTRLNHMATSCVGCGMCEAACPHDIPLTAMFRSVGARVQKLFDYEPGRDLNEKPPFMEWKRDELVSLGEERS